MNLFIAFCSVIFVVRFDSINEFSSQPECDVVTLFQQAHIHRVVEEIPKKVFKLYRKKFKTELTVAKVGDPFEMTDLPGYPNYGMILAGDFKSTGFLFVESRGHIKTFFIYDLKKGTLNFLSINEKTTSVEELIKEVQSALCK